MKNAGFAWLVLLPVAAAAQSGSWETTLEEDVELRLDLAESGALTLAYTLAAEDTFLVQTVYTGTWETAADSLFLNVTDAEIVVNEILVGEVLPALLAGILAGLQEWLTGTPVTEEELEALIEELQAEMEAERLELTEGLPERFGLVWKLTGDTLVILDEEEEIVFARRATAVEAISWAQVKRLTN